MSKREEETTEKKSYNSRSQLYKKGIHRKRRKQTQDGSVPYRMQKSFVSIRFMLSKIAPNTKSCKNKLKETKINWQTSNKSNAFFSVFRFSGKVKEIHAIRNHFPKLHHVLQA